MNTPHDRTPASATDDLVDALEAQSGRLPSEHPAARGSREALELCLRAVFDDDDALSAAQIVVAEGWRPPDEADRTEDEREVARHGGW